MTPDSGSDGCNCTGGDVYRFHECVATLELGCGPSCDPLGTDCGEHHTCEPCGASTACDTRDCRPTCVFTGPAQGPLPEFVRISPTMSTAGQAVDILVEGFPWYIGALFYRVWLGSEEVTWDTQGMGTCSFVIHAPARPPGTFPIWVSEYGGDVPSALAGFFTYSGGDIWECVQPGFHCDPGETCCSLPDVTLACVAGRCHYAE